jgi:ubiquinone/menaquinone biosynthesis C-methylase UbiE
MNAEFELPGWLLPPEAFIIDVGGEGRHPRAWNLNQRRERSGISRAVGPIPRLILARAEAMPLAAASVDLAIVERTPLQRATLRELDRVVKPAGLILLRHAITPGGDPHRVALAHFAGSIERRVFAHRDYRVQETIIRRGHLGERRS